jgi:large subunit ribosomal protein L25
MELKMFSRPGEKKSQARNARLVGLIPAVIYSQGKAGENICIEAPVFTNFLAKLKRGRLATVQFTLVDEKGAKRQALVKDVQYNIINYDVIHLDFQEIHANEEINVKVPIECTGVNECVGINQGGVLRQVIRNVKVRCKPEKIPAVFELNVTNLELKQTKRLRDLTVPEGVRPLADLKEVAVVIAKR